MKSLPARNYVAERDGNSVIVTSLGKTGQIPVPVLGAVKHPDGTIVVEPVTPAPIYVIRECLDEVERILGDANQKGGV
ncbi:MAG: hypothetical protein CMO80_00530 [Verrucomicrobiales bacterium]|nr:hypothetical protein [Verrucomicrobiales bacterium]